MSTVSPHSVGSIGWVDVTVENPERLRDFYRTVVGWDAGEVPMGGYADFTMHPPGSTQPVAGICHARGGNAGLPPVWLVYFTVADLVESLAAVVAQGGAVEVPIRKAGGYGSYAVIRDPAGVVAALYEPAR